MFIILLRDLITDTDEQPDEEIHRARSGRVQVQERLSMRGWGCHPPCVDVFTNLEALQTPYFWYLWQLHHIDMINH